MVLLADRRRIWRRLVPAPQMGALLMRADPVFMARLAAADRAWQREKARVLWFRAVPWLLGLLLVAFAADAFLQLSRNARLVCLAVGASSALAAWAAGWYIGWVR